MKNKVYRFFRWLKIIIKYKYIVLLFPAIYKDAYLHIKRIIKKQSNPHILEITLPTTNPVILTMMANFITLTPGTITVDIKESTLFVLDIDSDSNPEHSKRAILNDYNNEPERKIFGFYRKDELMTLIQRRSLREPLASALSKIDRNIINRV